MRVSLLYYTKSIERESELERGFLVSDNRGFSLLLAAAAAATAAVGDVMMQDESRAYTATLEMDWMAWDSK